MRFLLTRHGSADYVETFFSDEGGWLSVEGRAQARAIAETARSYAVRRIWSSDVSRAAQTAEVAARELDLTAEPPVITRKSLREVFIGDLLGTPFDVTRIDAVVDRWLEPAPGDQEEQQDPASRRLRFPGGESGEEVISRMLATLGEIRQAQESDDETVLVVGHQMALATLLRSLTGGGVKLGNGEVVLLEAEPWRITRLGRAPGGRD